MDTRKRKSIVIKPLITSARIEEQGRKYTLTIWINGQNAGVLTCNSSLEARYLATKLGCDGDSIETP